MDNPISDINNGLKAAEGTISFLDKIFATADKWGFLPMPERRKKNMQTKQDFLLEMDAQKARHRHMEELADADVKARVELIMAQTRLGIEAAQQKSGQKENDIEDMTEHLALAGRAASSFYKQAMAEQYSKERIGMYAAAELAGEDKAHANGEEPSQTWMTRFLKYAGDVRDEDVMQLWGKVLAGEIKKPGSFSLKTMEILSTLDQRDAINFTKIAPYVIDDDFIPAGAFEKVGISFLDAADLDSLGLIHRRMMKRLKGIPSAINKKYMVLPRNVDSFPGAPCFDLEASLLTKVGMEIYGILNLAEDEYLEGAKFFANLITQKYGIPMECINMSTRKAE